MIETRNQKKTMLELIKEIRNGQDRQSNELRQCSDALDERYNKLERLVFDHISQLQAPGKQTFTDGGEKIPISPIFLSQKAYASVPDVEAMEKLLKRVEGKTPPFELAWQTGISMAKAYLKCGSSGKAIEMLRKTELVVNEKSKDAANKVLVEMYGEAGAKQDESRLSRRIYAKQGQRMGAYRSKGSGGRSSHHQGYYHGGCGGGCGGWDGNRADDNGGGVGADTGGGIGGGCGSGSLD
ncbi:hypothetical protein Bca4012_062729 [Brassica carinata]